MCGRFTLDSSGEELARQFDLAESELLLEPRYNVAPSQEVASVRCAESGNRSLVFQRWGLIPAWAKDPAVGNRMINARSESAADKPAFRDALSRRRCIVPADGFYEWRKGARAHGPHWIRPRGDSLLGFAGLWERWKAPTGVVVESCTILTTEANGVLRPLHDRMPAILDRGAYETWLDPRRLDAAELLPLLVPCPDEWLEAKPVGPRVNDVKYDDLQCLEAPAQRDLF